MNDEAKRPVDRSKPVPPLSAMPRTTLPFVKSPPVWFAFAFLIVGLDYLTGPSINLSLFFLVPVLALAWRQEMRWALAFAVALPLCRFWFEANWGAPWSLGDAAGNCLLRASALGGFAFVTSRLAGVERRLRDSEWLYHSLVENIPQGIFRKDIARRFTFANGRFSEHLEKPPKDVVGKLDEDLFPPELSAKYRKDDQCVIETGRNLETVEERRTLRGKPVFTHVIKTPLRDAENRIVGIQGIYWDITEQRLLQDQLRQAQKLEAVGQLAGGVAHNFNNILTSMLVSVELLLEENRLDAQARSSLQNLKLGIERAARLSRQLLLFSRPSKMQTQTVDLNKLVERFLVMLSQLIGEGISLRSELGGGSVEIEADGSMVEQILLDLAINARDAMPDGGVLTIAVSRRTVAADVVTQNPEAQAGQFAVLEVTDTGFGMDKATQERIFEPFFTTKDVGRGTGLGLSTVHGIVKQHHGWIEINSTPGRGSTFRIYMPSSAGTKQSDLENTTAPLQREASQPGLSAAPKGGLAAT